MLHVFVRHTETGQEQNVVWKDCKIVPLRTVRPSFLPSSFHLSSFLPLPLLFLPPLFLFFLFLIFILFLFLFSFFLLHLFLLFFLIPTPLCLVFASIAFIERCNWPGTMLSIRDKNMNKIPLLPLGTIQSSVGRNLQVHNGQWCLELNWWFLREERHCCLLFVDILSLTCCKIFSQDWDCDSCGYHMRTELESAGKRLVKQEQIIMA